MAKASKGFTLVEVLIALGIFFTLLVTLSVLFFTSIQTNLLTRHITAATGLAQDKLEELQNTAYAQLASGADASLLTATRGTTNGIFTRRWTVASGPVTGTQVLTVIVAWPDAGGRQVQLQTIRATS
ncbi:MAG: type II secretion system protein [Deltaproteobacteria bacterium]|nr:type II secretion system protein [Deltaproteobacteria bacterium]